MKRSYGCCQLEVACAPIPLNTYMPDERQILEVRQCEKNRSYPPDTSRRVVACPFG